MRQLVVLSGKGGTGKTSVVASFASLGRGHFVLADCDVDAPDLHFLLGPVLQEEHSFTASRLARIDPERCTRCGMCRARCRFNAISVDYRVDDIACEGCGLCAAVCPEGAIQMDPYTSGHWYRSAFSGGEMIHARLNFGEGNSGKLVTRVKEEARKAAERLGINGVIVDGPPGIGCPVIAALSGASDALLVTEPSRSGLHDLKRVLTVCRHFSVPAAICINRYDIEPESAAEIEETARIEGIPIAGRIPYDEDVVWALMAGVPVVDYNDGTAARAIRALWAAIAKGPPSFAESTDTVDGADPDHQPPHTH